VRIPEVNPATEYIDISNVTSDNTNLHFDLKLSQDCLMLPDLRFVGTFLIQSRCQALIFV